MVSGRAFEAAAAETGDRKETLEMATPFKKFLRE